MKRKLSQHEQMIRKFKKFLYDNDVLTEWTRTVNKRGFYGMDVAKVFKERPAKEWVNSFHWGDFPYWADLSVKWHEELSK
ncbi:MAG: hypothetical protein M0R17_08025 [Candidatus Omnitrophica bacterium]|jgi:hypothetical protein|nr:hypothetical protein [Candidatus Omnitrophota bacterium]